MNQGPIKIKPDAAGFMGSILLGLSVGWLVLGWAFSGSDFPASDVASRVAYILGVLCGVVGARSFDGAIRIYDSGVSQKRLGIEKFIKFEDIRNLQFTSAKTAHALVIQGDDAVISMSSTAFDRATVLRVRRAILERAPGVRHNSIPSDENYLTEPVTS